MYLVLSAYCTLRKWLVTMAVTFDMHIEIYWGCMLKIFLLRKSVYQTEVASAVVKLTKRGHTTLCPLRT